MILTDLQIQHLLRFLRQWLVRPRVGVIGGYHGGNLGDMALGIAVKELLSEKGIGSGLQTIYNLEKWRKAPYAILGGGAIAYNKDLLRVARRYHKDLSKVAILGVDFNEKEYTGEVLDLMREAIWVSCRSENQANRIASITGRNDISFHPDIAFALHQDFFIRQRKKAFEEKTKTLLVNVVPLYSVIKNGKLIPDERYRSERPELYEKYKCMLHSYTQALRTTVNNALELGFKVETISFTPEDDITARFFLENLTVQHIPYNAEINNMLNRIAGAQWVLSTRYHATIFAIKAGARITPMAYATKNEQLLLELGVDRSSFLSTQDFADGKDVFPDAIHIDSNIVKSWEMKSCNAIKSCINTLL